LDIYIGNGLGIDMTWVRSHYRRRATGIRRRRCWC